jgi:Bacterial regulatory helix-turn-helix protein, lysR family
MDLSASGQYHVETWKTRWASNFERCAGLLSQLSTKAFGRQQRLSISGSRHSSRGLRDLEHQLGAILFERTNGGARPTLAGEEFLDAARRIIKEAEAIAAIAIVMQRVHMDDLTGFLLSQSSEWELLSLPAIAEFEETIALGNGHSHRRQFGEALSPEREPVHVLEALKLQIGSDAFSAQYQQAPVPPGGAMVKHHWVRRYGDQLPSPTEQLMTVQSWDVASKGGPDNDSSVCTT